MIMDHGFLRFSTDHKAWIIAETLVAGAVVSDYRQGLTPQELFTWRRQTGRPVVAPDTEGSKFVPAVVETGLPESY